MESNEAYLKKGHWEKCSAKQNQKETDTTCTTFLEPIKLIWINTHIQRGYIIFSLHFLSSAAKYGRIGDISGELLNQEHESESKPLVQKKST